MLKWKTIILNCNNISQYYSFHCIFLSNKCSFGEHKWLTGWNIWTHTHTYM